MIKRLTLTALATAAIAAPAVAASTKTFDLELVYPKKAFETVEGAEKAYVEIVEQVEAACIAERRKDRSFGIRLSWRKQDGCEARTLDAAVQTIDHPRLTAIHAARAEG
jgi:UrcA family protein